MIETFFLSLSAALVVVEPVLTPAVAHEVVSYGLPSPALCLLRPKVRDFGPPEGCDNTGSEHPKSVVLNSLATGTSVTSANTLTTVGYVLSDPEHVVLEPRPQTKALVLKSIPRSGSPATLGQHGAAATYRRQR